MKKKTIIVVSADANFFDWLEESTNSLLAVGADAVADVGIMDLGLTPEQAAILKTRGFQIVTPHWTFTDLTDVQYKKHEIGLVARTALRDYFPGYQTYLWFDSDAWAQTPEFLSELIGGATAKGAAIIREDGPQYKRDFVYNKWLYGNMILSYGAWNGVRVARKPSFNIGIFCLSDTAPHWDIWIKYFKLSLKRLGKINMDQHAFNAAIELANLPYHHAPARCNWIPVLSAPWWDEKNKLLCEPIKNGKPLSIIHLAGPDKKRPYSLQTENGIALETSLNFSALKTSAQTA